MFLWITSFTANSCLIVWLLEMGGGGDTQNAL